MEKNVSNLLEVHPQLALLLQKAYSGERAASLAYIGHAASLSDPDEAARVQEIEMDEWGHRHEVLQMMRRHGVPVSSWLEWKFLMIGKVIGWSCHVIGWFMPYFFAGKLESGNVCEYFVMMHWFHDLGIRDHDEVLYEMGMKEKEHEVYFLQQLENASWLPWFERIFGWGKNASRNDVILENRYSVEKAGEYCRTYRH